MNELHEYYLSLARKLLYDDYIALSPVDSALHSSTIVEHDRLFQTLRNQLENYPNNCLNCSKLLQYSVLHDNLVDYLQYLLDNALLSGLPNITTVDNTSMFYQRSDDYVISVLVPISVFNEYLELQDCYPFVPSRNCYCVLNIDPVNKIYYHPSMNTSTVSPKTQLHILRKQLTTMHLYYLTNRLRYSTYAPGFLSRWRRLFYSKRRSQKLCSIMLQYYDDYNILRNRYNKLHTYVYRINYLINPICQQLNKLGYVKYRHDKI